MAFYEVLMNIVSNCYYLSVLLFPHYLPPSSNAVKKAIPSA